MVCHFQASGHNRDPTGFLLNADLAYDPAAVSGVSSTERRSQLTFSFTTLRVRHGACICEIVTRVSMLQYEGYDCMSEQSTCLTKNFVRKPDRHSLGRIWTWGNSVYDRESSNRRTSLAQLLTQQASCAK